MATKRTNEKYVELECGYMVCYTTRTRNYVTEHVEITINDREFSGTYKWQNRPWQSFDYDSATTDAIEKMPKSLKEYGELFYKRLSGESQKRVEEMEKALKNLSQAYDALPDNLKEITNRSDVEVRSAEDANRLAGIMNLFSLMASC